MASRLCARPYTLCTLFRGGGRREGGDRFDGGGIETIPTTHYSRF